jgi:hypothetical protein
MNCTNTNLLHKLHITTHITPHYELHTHTGTPQTEQHNKHYTTSRTAKKRKLHHKLHNTTHVTPHHALLQHKATQKNAQHNKRYITSLTGPTQSYTINCTTQQQFHNITKCTITKLYDKLHSTTNVTPHHKMHQHTATIRT